MNDLRTARDIADAVATGPEAALEYLRHLAAGGDPDAPATSMAAAHLEHLVADNAALATQVAEWSARFDALAETMAHAIAIADATIAEYRRADEARNRVVFPRRPSPMETGTGPCPVAGCAEVGGHRHPFWQTAKAAGRLTPDLAARWSTQQWIEYLRDHGPTQAEGVAELRSWADAHWGEDPPAGLRSVKDRPDLANVLLAYAERTAAARDREAQPWS